jgi:hypothetical protein
MIGMTMQPSTDKRCKVYGQITGRRWISTFGAIPPSELNHQKLISSMVGSMPGHTSRPTIKLAGFEGHALNDNSVKERSGPSQMA